MAPSEHLEIKRLGLGPLMHPAQACADRGARDPCQAQM